MFTETTVDYLDPVEYSEAVKDLPTSTSQPLSVPMKVRGGERRINKNLSKFNIINCVFNIIFNLEILFSRCRRARNTSLVGIIYKLHVFQCSIKCVYNMFVCVCVLQKKIASCNIYFQRCNRCK